MTDLAELTTVGLRLVDIRTDGGTQTRASLDQEAIERYQAAAKLLPPVHVFYDGAHYWLADGFHRREAWERAGMDFVSAIVHQGSLRDAVLYAAGANASHGLVRSREDARRAVERLLSDEEWRARSDRWIAEACHVSHSWVGRIRAEIGAHAEVRQFERGGATHQQSAAKRGAADHLDSESRRATQDSEVQAPEPDNMLRTPVQHEHKGAPLTEKMRDGIRALYSAARDAADEEAWGDEAVRRALAEKYRVTLAEVDEAIGEAPESRNPAPVVQDAEPSAKADPHVVDDDDDGDAPSSPPPGERDLAHDQWWTPPELADEMVRLAGVQPGDQVLEPSAGAGAIVEALIRAGATVEAHELDPRWAAYLRICGRHDVTEEPRWKSEQVEVFEGSYLEAEPVEVQRRTGRPYARAVINPPYKNGMDGAFLGRVLDEADVVVALLRVNALCGQERYRTVWEKHGGRCTGIHPLVIRPDFTGSDRGSEGQGAKSDFVVLVFGAEDLGERAPVRHLAARYGGRA